VKNLSPRGKNDPPLRNHLLKSLYKITLQVFSVPKTGVFVPFHFSLKVKRFSLKPKRFHFKVKRSGF